MNLDDTLIAARRELVARLRPEGCWSGRLSGSALSTATAVGALAVVDKTGHAGLIERGVRWLIDHRNADGGWGDTTISRSNLSTTLLVRGALAIADTEAQQTGAVESADRYLKQHVGSLEGGQIAAAVTKCYGEDRTFAAPILTMCAIGGLLGLGRAGWRHVPGLPFELAVLPHRLLRWLRLPVVSYALPALIGVGVAVNRNRPPRNPAARLVRWLLQPAAIRKLARIQPGSGGFLEAPPLTGFVVMGLVAAGFPDHAVVRRGVDFLRRTVREDGSWPIDTNLATWVTTLSVQALAAGTDDMLTAEQASALRRWLLACQHTSVHPYTGAAPGGWAWADLPGGVPDADDTAGALLALRNLGPLDDKTRQAAAAGAAWLLDLQNRDGGMPTFCRGWGRMPFDRSCPDLTAHAVRAWLAWQDDLPPQLRKRTSRAMDRAIAYLERSQRVDGSWRPLWFGNEAAVDQANDTYGTSRVLMALAESCMKKTGVPSRRTSGRSSRASSGLAPGTGAAHPWHPQDPCASMAERAVAWLVSAQNGDGGWGGAAGVASSVEETAVAVEALATTGTAPSAVTAGVRYLIDRTRSGTQFEPSPIGLYFARLWYFEELYPLIFSVSALGRASAAISANALQPAFARRTID